MLPRPPLTVYPLTRHSGVEEASFWRQPPVFNHVATLLCYHYGGSIGVSWCQLRHDAGVHHTKAIYAVHLKKSENFLWKHNTGIYFKWSRTVLFAKRQKYILKDPAQQRDINIAMANCCIWFAWIQAIPINWWWPLQISKL